MDLRGKRFLVVGGAGFIGSHTVDLLLREDVEEIRVFDNFARGRIENLSSAVRDSRVRVVDQPADILHVDLLERAMQGIDGVFHFAALWLWHCQEFPRAAYEVNVGGTFNVIEACTRAAVRRLVFSSSASVYGDAVSEPMTEDHPFHNRTLYGATKVAGEQLCRATHHRSGLDFVGLRYMNVYGPRQDDRGAYTSVIVRMLDRLERGEQPVVHGDGSQAYDFVDVTDCARANVCAMRSATTDDFYNVGTGVKTSVRELANLCVELSGSTQAIQYVPATVTFVRNRVGSTEKAERELGFRAATDLRAGLARFVEWRRDRLRVDSTEP